MIHGGHGQRSIVAAILVCVAAVGCDLKQPPAAAPANPQGNARAGATGPAVAATPTAAAAADASALYSAQTGGEQFAPESSPPSTPLRARKADTFFRLSNPRFEPVGKQPFPYLAVDYERVSEGSYNGQALIVRDARGHDQTVLLAGPFDRAGVIEINVGFGAPGTSPPKDAEFYMTRQERRYGGEFLPTFKVSNSVVMGTTKFPVTLARNWTTAEVEKLRQPPPEGPKPNAHPDVGEDTKFVGDENGGSFRYAEAGKPVIGVEFWAGAWDNEPCLARLIPVHESKQPTEPATKRIMAKSGYAVGGMTVRSKRYVNAVRVAFMKLKPDGGLDPADKYASEWLGPDVEETKETELGGDGRAVVGLHCRQGAILNAMALVMHRP